MTHAVTGCCRAARGGVRFAPRQANAAAIAFAVDLTRLPIYFGQGFSRSVPWTYYPLLVVIAWLGAFVGRRLVTRIAQDRFRRVVFALLLVTGLVFTLRWIQGAA